VDGATFYNRDHPERSMRIANRVERSRWQDTSSSARSASQHLLGLMHLIEIARRHSDVVGQHRVMMQLCKLKLTPTELWYVAVDLCRFTSPTIVAAVRRAVIGAPAPTQPGTNA
jgi:hypothetical protein